MRVFRGAALLIGVLLPAVADAGQIYGTIVLDGKGVRTKLEIVCGDATTPANSTPDGSYRVNVAQQGQCLLKAPEYMGTPSAEIFSGPNPAQYNFEIVRKPDGTFELRRK